MAIDQVVRDGLCSGCGACLLLDSGLEMRLDDGGFAIPQRRHSGNAAPDAASHFAASCPGMIVRAARPRGAERHQTMGPVVAAWEGWATDDETRRAGSSGGVLTALAAWLVETGRAHSVVGATSQQSDPRRSVAVRLTTREEALAAAGSRYAPVTSRGVTSSGVTSGSVDPADATIGLPCRVSAMRQLQQREAIDDQVLLSFFCAGTPSQAATDALAAQLGPVGAPAALRYRGDGWPGRFVVTRHNGSQSSLSYAESWGDHLGRAVHPRCKLCPDGVGESADVSAADFWQTDERGYPAFEDADGRSAIIARTERGYRLVLDAIRAGVLTAHPLRIEQLAAVQGLQVERRTLLAGRLLGAVTARRKVPRYRGFGLILLVLPRWRAALRAARGTRRRMRRTAPGRLA